MKYVIGTVVVIGLLVGGWFGYWGLARANQQQQYQVNTDGQQYQASLISQERDRVVGYDTATVDAQKQQIKSTFCAVYQTLKPAPDDLIQAYARICS